MKIELFNNNILVKAIQRGNEVSAVGVYIPVEDLEEEQVSQGIVIQDVGEFKKDDILLFHKTMPVDVNMKLDGDSELQNYFFIKVEDIICRIK